MAITVPEEADQGQQVGKDPANHWRYDQSTGLIDLTRDASPSSFVTLKTTTNPVRLAPNRTALVIIDMQNFFLSPALGRPERSAGLDAAQKLLETGVPAARKKGIRVVWVNWGLTEEEAETMPPGVVRAFGVYETIATNNGDADGGQKTMTTTKKKKNRTIYKGIGADLGPIDLGDGTVVEGGRVLMRDAWNTALYAHLDAVYREGLQRPSMPDVWIHKNRMSGLWGPGTELESFLRKEGITTLLFAGVNTDQCVGGTLVDAFSKGFDCIFLRDASATSSPPFAQEAWEWNCENCWGFVSWCGALSDG